MGFFCAYSLCLAILNTDVRCSVNRFDCVAWLRVQVQWSPILGHLMDPRAYVSPRGEIKYGPESLSELAQDVFGNMAMLSHLNRDRQSSAIWR